MEMGDLPQSVIHLRTLGNEDWALWRQLRLNALAEAPYAFSSKLSDWQGDGDTELRWRARLTTVPINIVAELNDLAAGMVSATSPSADGAVELISMWVAPFARGLSVGDSLVKAVVEWAQQQRASRVVLEVFESNKAAIALYLRHRFVDHGIVSESGSGLPREHQMIREIEIP